MEERDWDESSLTPRQRNTVVIGLLLGMLFSSLDTTVVGTSMPKIIGELGGLYFMAWVTTIYLLTSTVIIPIAGKLADQFGRKPVFLFTMGIFTLGSVLAGLSWDIWSLIIFRGIQGLGAGAIFPLTITISGDIFSGQDRAKFSAISGAVYFISLLLGPQLGGWIVEHLSWRWVFYINLPVGVLSLLCVLLALKVRAPKSKHQVDYFGAITMIVSLVSLLLVLTVGGKQWAWTSPQILGLILLATVSTAIFWFVERRVPEPILDIQLFKNRLFVITSIIGAIQSFVMLGAILFLPLYFQGVLEASPTKSGTVLTPMMVVMVLASFVMGAFTYRISVRLNLIIGLGITAFGFILMTHFSMNLSWLEATLVSLIVGIGLGFLMPILLVVVQDTFPPEKRGVVTSSNQFFRQIGGAFGVAVLGIVFNYAGKTYITQEAGKLLNNHLLSTEQRDSLIRLLQQPVDVTFRNLLTHAYDPLSHKLLSMLKVALSNTVHVIFWWLLAMSVLGIIFALLVGPLRLTQPERNRRSVSRKIQTEPKQSSNFGIS